jgi:hypothetical protein
MLVLSCSRRSRRALACSKFCYKCGQISKVITFRLFSIQLTARIFCRSYGEDMARVLSRASSSFDSVRSRWESSLLRFLAL